MPMIGGGDLAEHTEGDSVSSVKRAAFESGSLSLSPQTAPSDRRSLRCTTDEGSPCPRASEAQLCAYQTLALRCRSPYTAGRHQQASLPCSRAALATRYRRVRSPSTLRAARYISWCCYHAVRQSNCLSSRPALVQGTNLLCSKAIPIRGIAGSHTRGLPLLGSLLFCSSSSRALVPVPVPDSRR